MNGEYDWLLEWEAAHLAESIRVDAELSKLKEDKVRQLTEVLTACKVKFFPSSISFALIDHPHFGRQAQCTYRQDKVEIALQCPFNSGHLGKDEAEIFMTYYMKIPSYTGEVPKYARFRVTRDKDGFVNQKHLASMMQHIYNCAEQEREENAPETPDIE